MVFLLRPDEKRLWIVIAVVFASAFLLLWGSLQFPWFAASYYPSDAQEYRGEFSFSEATVRVYSNNDAGTPRNIIYGDDSPFGDLMSTTEGLVGFGNAMLLLFAGLVFAYYRGWVQRTLYAKMAWLVGFPAIVVGVAYFALNAGTSAVNEIQNLMEQIPAFNAQGAPDPVFWGEQRYANGDLYSNPGPGWILAILGLLDFAAGTLLLYQFPDSAEEPAPTAIGDGMKESTLDTQPAGPG